MFEDIFDPFYLEKLKQQQLAELNGPAGQPGVVSQQYAAQAPEERQGWLDQAYEDSLGGLSYIGKILDKTFGGRAIRGVLGGAPEEALSIIPMSDTLGLTSSANEVSGRQLLDKSGLTTAGDDSWANTIAGVGAEILLDPSTYATFGGTTLAGQAAKKAGTAVKGLGPGIRAGERSLVGFGLPFGQQRVAFGTGAGTADVVEAIPKYLGKAVPGPIKSVAGGLGRAIGTHFDPAVAGATTGEVQPIAREVFTPGLKAYSEPIRNVWADAVEELNPIIQQGPDIERALMQGMRGQIEMMQDPLAVLAERTTRYNERVADLGQQLSTGKIGQQGFNEELLKAQGIRDQLADNITQNTNYFTQNDPVAMMTAAGIDPAGIATAEKHARAIFEANQAMRRAEQSRGIVSNELDDFIGYAMRQQSSLPKAEGEGLWKYLGRRATEGSAAFDPTQRQRLEPFRNIPGGTNAINDMMKDPALRGMQPDKLEEYLRTTLTGNPMPPANYPAWEQAKELAGIIQNSDPRYPSASLDYFTQDLLKGLQQKGQIHSRKMALSDSIIEGVKKTAVPQSQLTAVNRSGIPLEDVMDKAGFVRGGQGWNDVMQHFGVGKSGSLKGHSVPEDVAADLMKLGEAWKTPAALAPVVQAWDMAMNMFKTNVTAAFPAFHTRNVMSGMFNMWRDNALSMDALKEMQAVQRGGFLSDSMAQKLFPGSGMTAQEATSAFKKELLANNVAFTRESRRLGADVLGPTERLTTFNVPVTTGQAKSFGQVGKDFASGFKPTDEARQAGYGTFRQLFDPTLVEGVATDKTVNRFIDRGRKVGETAEDWMRGSHYMAKRMNGFAPDVAAEGVMKYHIDYTNLTQTEKQVMKRMVPWYSFSRRSLPVILEDLATQPAKITAATHLTAGGRDKGEFAPGYIAEGASLPFFGAPEGHSRFLSSFGLPIEDEAFKTLGSALHGNIKRTVGGAFGMINPFMKAIPEQAFGQQFYSGRNLADLEPSTVVSLGGLVPQRTAQTLTQFFANTPAARVISTADRALDTRKWDGSGLLNLGTGMRVSDVNLERTKPAAQREWLQQELRPAAATKVREEVYVPIEKRGQLNPVDQYMLDQLMGLQKQQSAAARERKASGSK